MLSRQLPKTSTACVLTGRKKLEYQERPLPTSIKPDSVILEIQCVGLCGSDVHYWSDGKVGPFEVKGPIIMGHESSAIVVAVGAEVTSLKIGDRVAIEPGYPCRKCALCRSGRYNLCGGIVFHATPPYDGTLQNFLEHPADFCFKIPAHVSFAEAAFIEPLSVGVQACTRSNVTIGSHVLICGCGPIGLVCMLVARAAGATKIIMTDINETRLQAAKKLGADAVFNSSLPESELLSLLGEFSPISQTLECSGAESAIILAIRATTAGGKIVSIGRSAKPFQTIPLFEAADKEIDLLGTFRYHDSYPAAIGLVASGRVRVTPLITAYYPLAKAQEAFEKAAGGGEIKVMINLNLAPEAAKL